MTKTKMLTSMRSGADIFARLGRCNAGVAAVEWAAIASFLIFMTIGAVDFALAAQHKMQMANAVRAGIQYATVRKPVQQDTSGIVDAINTAAPIDESGTRTVNVTFYCECPDGTAIDCSDSCATGTRQSYVAIDIQEQHDLMLGLSFLTETLTLRSQGSVRLN